MASMRECKEYWRQHRGVQDQGHETVEKGVANVCISIQVYGYICR